VNHPAGTNFVGPMMAFLLVGTAFYFIPLIIAIVRKKGNVVAIGALNLLLGWTLVGWVVSLVWSLSKDQQPQQVVIHQTIAGGTGTTYGVEPRNDA